MARSTSNIQWQKAIVLLSGTVLTAALVLTLYWGQIVFVPVALSILFMFLLTPAVRWLERRGLKRALSVGIVVLVSLVGVGELTWIITRQMAGLAKELPDYSVNIQRKIQALRESSSGWDRVQKMVEEITTTVQPTNERVLPGLEGAAEPPTVVVRPESGWLGRWPHFLGSAVEVAAGGALVFILTIFGLFKREDLRNRFLRLIGHRRLTFTTKAVDEAGERVSRYLLTQALVNIAYGLALSLGLAVLGVKYALLWGFIAAILRYVPYLGTWLSMMFPLAVSIATAETWFQPLAAFGVFIVLEVITYNFVEPLLFRRSMGVSEVAQLVSAAFWGFLWGPVGLVLSAPLTVCLLVVGKYVPQFSFMEVLLGDDPPLEPSVSFYQRLLARDEDDATQLIQEQLKKSAPEDVYDDLLIPALNFVKRDRIRDEVSEEDETFVLRAIRDVTDEITLVTSGDLTSVKKVHVLACPAFDRADVMALEMLQKLMSTDRWEFNVVPADLLTAEVVDRAVKEGCSVVCIGSVPPGGLAHTRFLCKRLRTRLPNVKILVGRWGHKVNELSIQQLTEAGADAIGDTLQTTRNQLNTWLPIFVDADVENQSTHAKSLSCENALQELAAV